MPDEAVLALPKAPTGIRGLDEITGGGLPAGRPTLVAGAAGCGKTLLAMEFLIRGATEFGEPGVFMAFEETSRELIANVRSLGFDLDELVTQRRIALDHVRVERSEIEETGEYDLEGLFIRLEHAVQSIGAKRVVLDTVESLFAALPNQLIVRAELRRLFGWLKQRGLTAIITGERGGSADDTLTRHGLEEYVADCVITLDHRVSDQVSTRRLRVVKYRGSMHGTNEYPFLIGARGISVMPVTSMRLDHVVGTERISSGVAPLDVMLGGKGFFRGSSVLVSGSPGTGKTSLAAHFVDATCRRGERCLVFAYEESASQVIRNMRSIGLDLEQWVHKGLLQIHASRPTLCGLEMHLVTMHDLVQGFRPTVVVVDPVSNLTLREDDVEVKPTLMRLVDLLKTQHVTGMFTSLTPGGSDQEESQVGISSLMDTWLLLRNIENNGEKTRTFYVLKSRGMAHSNQVREFVMTGKGVDLREVYVGGNTVLTGTARVVQETRERTEAVQRRQEQERQQRQFLRRRKAIEAQIALLQADLEAEEDEIRYSVAEETLQKRAVTTERRRLARLRGGTT